MSDPNVQNLINYLESYHKGGFLVDSARLCASFLRQYQNDIKFKHLLAQQLIAATEELKSAREINTQILDGIVDELLHQLRVEKEEMELMTIEYVEKLTQLQNENEFHKKTSSNLFSCLMSKELLPTIKGHLMDSCPDATGREITAFLDGLVPAAFGSDVIDSLPYFQNVTRNPPVFQTDFKKSPMYYQMRNNIQFEQKFPFLRNMRSFGARYPADNRFYGMQIYFNFVY